VSSLRSEPPSGANSTARARRADPTIPGLGPADGPVEVRRSARRRQTVTAYREGGRTIVLIPARFSKAEERRWVADMLARLDARDQRQRRGPRRSDSALQDRARALAVEYFAGDIAPVAVRWVDNMTTRWASCTPADGTIRVSSRLRTMPTWVLDYVLVHELAHLITPLHDERFWSLVAGYPRAERARGYLEGVAAAGQLDLSDEDVLGAHSS
jgi:predicted metal-dependent hydrolase